MKQFYPHIHDDLQHIVNRALAKNPAERYQSCGEFGNFIKDYMHRRNLKQI